MKQNRLFKFLIGGTAIAITIAIIWFINQSSSIADVGSFESYSSGGSSSGSSWSSGSSSSSWSSGSSGSSWGSSSSGSGWSSRSYDSDTSWNSRNNSSNSSASVGGILFIMVMPIVAVIIILLKNRNKPRNIKQQYEQVRNNSIYDNGPDRSSAILEEIHKHDPNFNADKFKSYAKDVFIKLQNAWTERDWEKIRAFESNELFEQHKAQLDGYIKNNQINVMERICVNWVRMISYEKTGGKEILSVTINSRMGDYIIDATTKEVVRGNKFNEYTNTYVMQFVRTEGVLTPESGDQVNTTNCPNCGAPTKVMTSGRCEFCNSVITTTKHGWVLNSLERK